MDDFVFTFDVNPFLSAIDRITEGFGTLKNTLTKFDTSAQETSNETIKKTTKTIKHNTEQLKKNTSVSVANFSDNAGKMINNLIKKMAALGAAYLSFKAILKYIPEITTAFKSMGNIFLRNFLWPLRQYLIPLLQKMLMWVKDNRAMFVKWGTVLMNAFRGVVEIVKGLFEIVKSFLAGFSDTFKRLFGTTVKSISDVINILLFKATVLAQFLISVLKPVFEKIGEWVAVAVKAISQFIKGFAEGFGNIAEPFQLIRNLLRGIITDLSGSTESTTNWMEGFRKAGLVIGGVLRTIITGVALAIDSLYMLMQTLTQAIKFVGMFFSGASNEDFKKQWKETSGIYERFIDRMKNYGKDVATTWGNIADNWPVPGEKNNKETNRMKNYGKDVATTWGNIADNWPVPGEKNNKETITTIPVKESNKSEKTINSNVRVGDVNVYVTTPDKAENVGRNIGKGITTSLHNQMRKNISDAMLGVATQ